MRPTRIITIAKDEKRYYLMNEPPGISNVVKTKQEMMRYIQTIHRISKRGKGQNWYNAEIIMLDSTGEFDLIIEAYGFTPQFEMAT